MSLSLYIYNSRIVKFSFLCTGRQHSAGALKARKSANHAAKASVSTAWGKRVRLRVLELLLFGPKVLDPGFFRTLFPCDAVRHQGFELVLVVATSMIAIAITIVLVAVISSSSVSSILGWSLLVRWKPAAIPIFIRGPPSLGLPRFRGTVG